MTELLIDELTTVATTTSHPEPPQPPSAIRQSFDAGELKGIASAPDTALIVHHGDPEPVSGFRLRASYRELGLVFCHTAGPAELSLDHLLEGLSTKGDSGGRVVLAHGGELNRRALAFALRQHLPRLATSASARLRPDYQSLAAACVASPGNFVVGLRGTAARDSRIRPVAVNGIYPWHDARGSEYPLQYSVHLYVPIAPSKEARAAAARFIGTVVARHAEDRRSHWYELGARENGQQGTRAA